MNTKHYTWKDCNDLADHVERDNNNKIWCYLCNKHHQELEIGLDKLDTRIVLRNWILAQGGAKSATDRMLNKL